MTAGTEAGTKLDCVLRLDRINHAILTTLCSLQMLNMLVDGTQGRCSGV